MPTRPTGSEFSTFSPIASLASSAVIHSPPAHFSSALLASLLFSEVAFSLQGLCTCWLVFLEGSYPRYSFDSLSPSHCSVSPSQCVLSRFSRVWLWATLCTEDRQAPLSMGFSRQGYWSGLLCPPPGDFPHNYSEIFPNPTLPTNFWWLKVDVFHTIIIWFRKPTMNGHIRPHWT